MLFQNKRAIWSFSSLIDIVLILLHFFPTIFSVFISITKKKIFFCEVSGGVQSFTSFKCLKYPFNNDGQISNFINMVQARLAFCKFMVKPSILLVLDEPTNYLDIPSKEMLEIGLFFFHRVEGQLRIKVYSFTFNFFFGF